MFRLDDQPYVIPYAYFSAVSVFPFDSPLLENIGLATRKVVASIQALRDENARTPLPHGSYAQPLLPVRAALKRLYQMTFPAYQTLFVHNHFPSPAPHALQQGQASTSHDRYFHIVRIPDSKLGITEFLAQHASSAYMILSDVPFSTLSNAHLDALLAGIESLFAYFGADQPVAEESSSATGDSWVFSWEQSWEAHQNSFPDSIPTFRWIVGHHLFSLCLNLAAHMLTDASHSLFDNTKCANNITCAASLMEAGIICMIYSINYSPGSHHVQFSSMIDEERISDGFFCDGNIEFNRFHMAHAHLGQKLDQENGASPAARRAWFRLEESYLRAIRLWSSLFQEYIDFRHDSVLFAHPYSDSIES